MATKARARARPEEGQAGATLGAEESQDSSDTNGVKDKEDQDHAETDAGKGPNEETNDSDDDEDEDGLFGGHDDSDDDEEDDGGSADDDYQPAASTSSSRPALRSSTRSSSSRRSSNPDIASTKQTQQPQESQARPSKSEKPSNHAQELAKSPSIDVKGKQKAIPTDLEEQIPATNDQRAVTSQSERSQTPSSSGAPLFNPKRASPTRKALNGLANIPEEEASEASKPESKQEEISSEQASSPGFNMLAIKNAFNASQTATNTTVPPTSAQLHAAELRKHIYQLQITTLLHINVELVKMCMVYQENARKAASPGEQPDFAMDDPYLGLVKRMSSNLGYLAHLNGTNTSNGVPPLPVLEPPPNAIEHLRNLYVQLGRSFVMGQRSGLFPSNQQSNIPRKLRLPSQTAMGQTRQQADQPNNLPSPPEQATPVTGKRDRRGSTVLAADEHQPSHVKREKLDNGQQASSADSNPSPSKESESSSPRRTDAMTAGNTVQPRNRQASAESSHSRAQTPRLPNAQQQQAFPTPGSVSSPMQQRSNSGGHSENQQTRPPSAGLPQQPGMYASTIPPHIQQHIQQTQAGQQNASSPYQQSATASQPRTPSAAGFNSPSSPGPNSAHFRHPSGPSMMQSPAGQPPQMQSTNNQGPQPQQGHRPSVNFEALAQDIVRTQQALVSARAAQDEKSVYGQLPPDSQAVLANRIHDLENQLDQYRRIYDQAVRGQSFQGNQGSPMSPMQQQQFQQLQQSQQGAHAQPGSPAMRPPSASQSQFSPQQQQPLQPVPYQQRATNQASQDQHQQQQQQQQQQHPAMSSPAPSHAASPAGSMHQSPQSAHLQGPQMRQGTQFAQPGGPALGQPYSPGVGGPMQQRAGQGGQSNMQAQAHRGQQPPNSGGRLPMQGQPEVQQHNMPPPRPPSVMRVAQSQQTGQMPGSPGTPQQAIGHFRAPSVPASGNPVYHQQQQQQAMNAGSPPQSFTAPSPAASVNGFYGMPAGMPSMPPPQVGQPKQQQQQQQQQAAQRLRMASLGGAPSNPNMPTSQMPPGQSQQQPQTPNQMPNFSLSQQQQQQQGPASQTQGAAAMYPSIMPGQMPPGAMQNMQNMQAFRGVPLQNLPPVPPGLNPQQAALYQQAQMRQQAILAAQQQQQNPNADQGQTMGQLPPGMMSQPNAQQLAFFRQQQQQQQQQQMQMQPQMQQGMNDGQNAQGGMDYAAQIAAVRRAQVESQMQMQQRPGQPGGMMSQQGLPGAGPGRMPTGYPGFGPPAQGTPQQQPPNVQARQQGSPPNMGPGVQQFAPNGMSPQGFNGQMFQQYGGQIPNLGQPGAPQKGLTHQRQMQQMHQPQFPMMPASQHGQQMQQPQPPGSAGLPNSAASVDFDAYLNMN